MTPSHTTAAVSVDLDAIGCYWRIHALPGEPPDDVRRVVLERCLPRFAELFADLGIKATLFVVGGDLDGDAAAQRLLGSLAVAGHELANHSFTHPYDLVRLPEADIAGEIDRAHEAIAAIDGRAPLGFRAPGYEVSAHVHELLCARSYRYDSSAFPSLPYYGAKAAVMGAMRVMGRKSGSILGSPRVLGAPLDPYHPAAGAPYERGSLPIWELPIAVTPSLRLPVFGTSLVTSPPWLRRRMVRSLLRPGLINLELHGIDLADAEGDGFPPALVARQPDLRRPLAAKREALRATIEELKGMQVPFVTLAAAAAELVG